MKYQDPATSVLSHESAASFPPLFVVITRPPFLLACCYCSRGAPLYKIARFHDRWNIPRLAMHFARAFSPSRLVSSSLRRVLSHDRNVVTTQEP